VISGAPAEGVFRRYQVPVEESNTPIPDFPVPVQSPTNGIKPGEGLDRKYYVPEELTVPMIGVIVAPSAATPKHAITAISKESATLHLFINDRLLETL
jgi:hypothetical protein